jgi:hypothetical protein
LYGSHGLRAKIEPPSSREYKPADFLGVRPLNWDEIINENQDGENWAHPGALSIEWGSPGNDNQNDNGASEEVLEGSVTRTGRGKGTEAGKGKGKRKGNGKLLNCMRQTWI